MSFSPSAEQELMLWAVQEGEDGWRAEVGLIRPAAAFDGAEVGDRIEFDLDEVGLEGDFEVVSVEPAPKQKAVAGMKRVTGVFRYSKATVYNLFIAGESKPLGVTENHPFWSVDRGGWIPQSELAIGERVRVSGGSAMVIGREYRGEEPVCNIEVEEDHCYRVGDQGILVHNTSAPCNQKTVQGYDCLTGCELFGKDFNPTDGKEFLQRDSLHRATGVKARLCKANIDNGSPADNNDDVVGWRKGWGGSIVRAHLLPERMGGPGAKDEMGALRNLVVVCKITNNRLKDEVEKFAYKWIIDGFIVDYEVRVNYKGTSLYPDSILVRACSVATATPHGI